MKTALYFDENDAQLVLTPETEWEKSILKMIRASYPDATFWGEFYACNGGWIRQSQSYSMYESTDSSLIMRMPKTPIST